MPTPLACDAQSIAPPLIAPPTVRKKPNRSPSGNAFSLGRYPSKRKAPPLTRFVKTVVWSTPLLGEAGRDARRLVVRLIADRDGQYRALEGLTGGRDCANILPTVGKPQVDQMSLGLEIRMKGRPRIDVSIEKVRALGPKDIEGINELRGTGRRPDLQTIRDVHHAVARLLAAGEAVIAVSAITGLTPTRISQYKTDPAMVELIEFYRQSLNKEFVDFAGRLNVVGQMSTAKLLERLEDEDPEKPIPVAQLLEISKFAADRTGFGPQTKQTNINVNIGVADRLNAARRRVAEAQVLPVLSLPHSEVEG